MQEEDYLINQELPSYTNLKNKTLPSQNYKKTKIKRYDDFNTTKIIFGLIALILSSILIITIVYYIPYFYDGWRFLSHGFSQLKAWSFFPGL
jgi:hypothetical protein